MLSLQKALKDRQYLVQDRTGEKEGIIFLAKTITGWTRSIDIAIEAGLVEYLKEWDDWSEGLAKRFLSSRHGTVDLDPAMAEVIEAVYRSSTGRRKLCEVGLLPERKPEDATTPQIEEVGVFISTSTGEPPVWLESMPLATELVEGLLEVSREAREARAQSTRAQSTNGDANGDGNANDANTTAASSNRDAGGDQNVD
jgi:hypothetical protein